jgi:hypothetical protein
MKKCEMSKKCPYPNLTKGPYCRNCSHNVSAWARKPLDKFLKRVKNLNYYSDRMAHVPHALRSGNETKKVRSRNQT